MKLICLEFGDYIFVLIFYIKTDNFEVLGCFTNT